MSLLTSLLRTLRRKFVFVLFGSVLGLILLANLAWKDCLLCGGEEDTVLRLRKLHQPFSWDLSAEEGAEGNSSEYKPATCRNSLQGKTIVADDKGYVCERFYLQGNGCCSINSTLGRFQCSGCDAKTECCKDYEFCISCCLRREQKPVLQDILERAAENNDVLFVSVTDHFELCLAKCRTSSRSVQHENTYRNKNKKFCYGKEDPPTLSSLEN